MKILRKLMLFFIGPLYTHYVSYLPLWYIYYSCGSRSPPRAAPARLHALVCVHAHVVSPALAVVVVSALRDVTDYRIVKGALFAAVGGPCLWLSAALSPHALTAPLVFGSGLAAALAAPLCTLLLCGRFILPALSPAVTGVVSVAVPYAAGVLFPSRQEPAASRLCALLLLYVESCDTLTHAEGMLYMSDVLVIVVLELTQLVTSAAWCWAWSRSAAVGAEWRLLALCAVPKGRPGESRRSDLYTRHLRLNPLPRRCGDRGGGGGGVRGVGAGVGAGGSAGAAAGGGAGGAGARRLAPVIHALRFRPNLTSTSNYFK
ncbi:uncharacterized protein LOC119190972 isoform X2 [Manduca sexta]|uniref:uncharacterized protein LOC119190972 isoform X2 n=1 Tax=Manduca sexta TaxID=7130 RepID=UPI0018905E1F|nr:uncharacterized protein LOC119190972 isoform X2 [Manduca sexta]